MDVIANKVGLYGTIREVGEKFTIADETELGSWMTPVSDKDAAAGIARHRAPIGTPARAETGPNPAIASQYAEAGHQTTALLLELQNARVELGAARTRIVQLEGEVARLQVSSGEADEDEVEVTDAAKQAKDEAKRLAEATKAAEEAQADPNRSENPELSEEDRKAREESAAEAEREKAEAEAKAKAETEERPTRRRRT